MRILFIGKRRYTNKDALRERFGRIYQLPLHWHAAGHQVELALLDYHGLRDESAAQDGFTATSFATANPATLIHLRALARSFRPDVVVGSGDCFVGLAAQWLAKGSGARFVFDVYDDYRTFGAYAAFLGWDAFGYLTRRASLIWYASRALAGVQDGPSAIVPNGVDPEEFRPIDATEARARVGLSGPDRWVGYFGSMEPDRGVDDLVSATAVLHAKDPRVRLVICGGSADRAHRQSAWIEDRGSVRHSEIPTFINACDVVVLPYRRGPAIDMVSSCKMAEYLYCARPIVATRVPSLTANFPRQAEELGMAIATPGDVPDLARAIAYQLEHAVVPSPPPSYAWREIAAAALDTLTR